MKQLWNMYSKPKRDSTVVNLHQITVFKGKLLFY